MVAEVLSVGSEVLSGSIHDTNATYLSQALADLGIEVVRRTGLGDDLQRVATACREAFQRADLVVVTGGLGPTVDDVTREAIASASDRGLVASPEAEQRIRRVFDQLGRQVTPAVLRQTLIPEGAKALSNSRGTAPGIWLDVDGKWVVALPGVPLEMETMFRDQVAPRIRSALGDAGNQIAVRTLHLCGIGESTAAERVGDLLASREPTVAPLIDTATGGVSFRITARAGNQEERQASLEAAERQIRTTLSEYVFGSEGDTLESVIGDLLATKGDTLAVAESCTAGSLAARVTSVSGSSRYFLGGLVTYSNPSKVDLLRVSPETLQGEGAVSPAVAQEMARGAREQFGATYALATTGIAGPTGGTPEKPVGLVYVGLATPSECRWERDHFLGEREDVRRRTVQAALTMLWRELR